MVHSSAAAREGNEGSESGEAAREVRLPLDDVDVDEGDSAESVTPESGHLRRSPRSMLESSLRAHTARLVRWQMRKRDCGTCRALSGSNFYVSTWLSFVFCSCSASLGSALILNKLC